MDNINNAELLELLHTSQVAYSRSIADLVEKRVMDTVPFDYAEVRRSYHKITQGQLLDHGFIHKQILEDLKLPCPF